MSDTESKKFRVLLLLLVLVKGKAKNVAMHRESVLANICVCLAKRYSIVNYLLYQKVKMGCLHCTNSLHWFVTSLATSLHHTKTF